MQASFYKREPSSRIGSAAQARIRRVATATAASLDSQAANCWATMSEPIVDGWAGRGRTPHARLARGTLHQIGGS